jgi:hypothetical protein
MPETTTDEKDSTMPETTTDEKDSTMPETTTDENSGAKHELDLFVHKQKDFDEFLGRLERQNESKTVYILTAEIVGKWFTDDMFAQLADLLNSPFCHTVLLSLHNCIHLTDASVARIATLSFLETLGLRNCRSLTGSCLAHLVGLPLRDLDLAWCSFTDVDLAHLSRMTSLQNLDLGGNNITDGGLVHLLGLADLRELSLNECIHISNRGMKHLATLDSLRSLNLNGCKYLTDGCAQDLAKLTSLQRLCMGGSAITGDIMRFLYQMPSLVFLDICYCWGITSEGIQAQDLPPSLKEVFMHNRLYDSVADFLAGHGIHATPAIR